MRCFKVYISTFLFLFLCSCNSAYFKEEIELDNNYWTYSHPVEFNFEVLDTSANYDMYLEIHHTDNYPYQNLYLQTTTSLPGDSVIQQLVSFELSDKAGFWLGKCQGNHCRISIPIQSNFHFTKLGEYGLRLDQFTRTDSLLGIEKIGLSLLEIGDKN
ncbi:MAG: gliding motility lipoprotein GldH [Bacteroidia bacterium]|nr:gliding motility lipoprotein GldH [Bacteroidia bacterium]